jgi:hypothetical protein
MQTFEIDANMNSHVGDIHKLLSQAIGENMTKSIAITRLSNEAVVKKLQEGKLKGIDKDMKISRTNFYHFYTEKREEIIIQTSPVKLAIFSDIPELN